MRNRTCKPSILAALLLAMGTAPAAAQRWATSWAAPDQGPYPGGVSVQQPDLRLALPDPAAGAKEQTLRLVVKPDLWGSRVRLRFSNLFGTKPVAFDGAFVGLHSGGATVMPQSNRPLLFGGKKAVVVQPGQAVWTDAVTLPYVSNPAAPELVGRALAVSFHVAGESGPVTWHALAGRTSYMTVPGAGALGELEDESAYANGTTSTFFLDALDVPGGPDTKVVVCLGGDLADGLGATVNGDDRWTDVLSRRLRAAGIRAAVVNGGIAGGIAAGGTVAANAAADGPDGAAPPAVSARVDRDVLGLSGVTHVILVGGLDDGGSAGRQDPDGVRDAMRQTVERIRAKLPTVRVIAATLPGAPPGPIARRASDADATRQVLNRLIRDSGDLFDGVVDFDAATADPQSHDLRPEFASAATGGAGDRALPNRAGHLAMGDAVNLGLIAAGPRPAPRRERVR